MGSVSTPALAAAVADAGGVGSVTALGMPVKFLDGLLADMVARTRGVVAVNFLTEELDRDALAVAASRARLIDFFWVHPSAELAEVVHAAGALVSWQVGSLDEARAAVDVGADIVVAQGVEAGGHVRGHTPLLPLLSSVLDAVDVPVLAAGGVADGRTLAAVLAAGADGARMGTRFVATTESGAHDLYKRAVVDAGADTTEITDAFAACPLCASSPPARVPAPLHRRRPPARSGHRWRDDTRRHTLHHRPRLRAPARGDSNRPHRRDGDVRRGVGHPSPVVRARRTGDGEPRCVGERLARAPLGGPIAKLSRQHGRRRRDPPSI